MISLADAAAFVSIDSRFRRLGLLGSLVQDRGSSSWATTEADPRPVPVAHSRGRSGPGEPPPVAMASAAVRASRNSRHESPRWVSASSVIEIEDDGDSVPGSTPPRSSNSSRWAGEIGEGTCRETSVRRSGTIGLQCTTKSPRPGGRGLSAGWGSTPNRRSRFGFQSGKNPLGDGGDAAHSLGGGGSPVIRRLRRPLARGRSPIADVPRVKCGV